MEAPIACTLDTEAAHDRIGEWRAVGVRSVASAYRYGPGRLELTLLPDADVESILRLARQEVACCAFFRFSLTIAAESVTLAIGVPDEASSVLDQFASAVSRGVSAARDT
jgi:hypothetical protein